jgi:hypothetical protein
MNFHFSVLTGPSGRSLCQSAPLSIFVQKHLLSIRVAITLKINALMRQPISLDDTDAYWVVSILRSNQRETSYNFGSIL